MDSGKFKYGIVFCGGAAKGAYQIGVWRCLSELGLDKEIIGVSGASVGAMNSMLFAQGDYDRARETWMQIRNGDMKPFNMPLLKGVLKSMVPYAASTKIASALELILWNPASHLAVGAVTASMAPVIVAGALASAGMGIKEILPQLSLFTHERLDDIIQNAVDPLEVTTSNKQVYTALTALSWPHLPDKSVDTTDSALPIMKSVGHIEYRSWKNLTYDEIVETVLASAALPVAYPSSGHKGTIYIDGGVLDNTPVKPLRDAGFRNIIVVHLDHLSKKQQQKKEEMVCSQGGAWVKFMHIWPSASLGDGMKISADLTRSRMNLGYRDTQSQLIPLFEKQTKKDKQTSKDMRDAEEHYELANKIYKQGIRDAIKMRNVEMFRIFLQTETGMTMLRNYEYAADLGHEQAEKMLTQIRRVQQKVRY